MLFIDGGWYTGYMTFSPGNYNFFGDDPALLSKLVITYEDGTEDVIVSDDDTWQVYNNGPIEYSSFFQGERYNAEKEDSIEDGLHLIMTLQTGKLQSNQFP